MQSAYADLECQHRGTGDLEVSVAELTQQLSDLRLENEALRYVLMMSNLKILMFSPMCNICGLLILSRMKVSQEGMGEEKERLKQELAQAQARLRTYEESSKGHVMLLFT